MVSYNKNTLIPCANSGENDCCLAFSQYCTECFYDDNDIECLKCSEGRNPATNC